MKFLKRRQRRSIPTMPARCALCMQDLLPSRVVEAEGRLYCSERCAIADASWRATLRGGARQLAGTEGKQP